MGIAYNTSQVTDGLVFSIDAANPRSYSGSGITVNGLVSGIGGTLVNGVGFGTTNSGSFIFDGTNDYINPTFPVSNNSDFTIGFWMNYQDATNVERGIVTTWDTSWNGFGIGTYQGKIRSWVGDGAGGGIQYVYINGLFLNSTGNNITLTHSSLQIARGGQSGSTQLTYYPYLNCQISQLSIYNRPLSAQEIRQNFNATRKRYGV